jgi:hypothetical protein
MAPRSGEPRGRGFASERAPVQGLLHAMPLWLVALGGIAVRLQGRKFSMRHSSVKGAPFLRLWLACFTIVTASSGMNFGVGGEIAVPAARRLG